MRNGNGTRILLVDDDHSILDILSDFLSGMGYTCAVADSGRKALASLDDGLFDLVVLDIKMPEMTGIETLRAIKQRLPIQPVIMLTAVAELDNVVTTMQLGAMDYILKPFALKELLAMIETALAKAAFIIEQHSTQDQVFNLVEEQHQQLEQKTREIHALNGLFRSLLNDVDHGTAEKQSFG